MISDLAHVLPAAWPSFLIKRLTHAELQSLKSIDKSPQTKGNIMTTSMRKFFWRIRERTCHGNSRNRCVQERCCWNVSRSTTPKTTRTACKSEKKKKKTKGPTRMGADLQLMFYWHENEKRKDTRYCTRDHSDVRVIAKCNCVMQPSMALRGNELPAFFNTCNLYIRR